jgi:ParB-like chromosome segregation protein Spo0J
MKLKINQLKSNESNPRIIKEAKFKKLVQSIKDFPEMLELRPIIVDENNTILGGNMRYKACVEAGLKEVPVKIAKDLTDEQKQEFIVKDNVGYGDWDWDMLGNEWNNVKLAEWGMDVWQPEKEVDYSILDDLDLGSNLNEKTERVKRAILIEFDASNYDEANTLIKKAREKGKDVGLIVLNAFRND